MSSASSWALTHGRELPEESAHAPQRHAQLQILREGGFVSSGCALTLVLQAALCLTYAWASRRLFSFAVPSFLMHALRSCSCLLAFLGAMENFACREARIPLV